LVAGTPQHSTFTELFSTFKETTMTTQTIDSAVEVQIEVPAAKPLTLAELSLIGGGDSTAFNLY
jgi:hypothetical protein